jgi:hypothetical protein
MTSPTPASALVLPDPKEVGATLVMLAGKPVPLVIERLPTPPRLVPLTPTAPTCPSHVSKLVTNEGAVIGCMAVDLSAAIQLGAMLMMLPLGPIKEQLAQKRPSDAVLESLSEVFSVLAGVVNRVDKNPHVIAKPVGPWKEAGPDAPATWGPMARNRYDLIGTGVAGPWRLSFIGR